MADELGASGRAILDHLNAIAERGPLVVQNLQARLLRADSGARARTAA